MTVSELKIKSNRSEVKNSASFDFEWVKYKGRYEHSKTRIFGASFCTNLGEKVGLHISRYAGEKALIQDILWYLNQFPLTFGWYSTGIVIYDEKGNRIKGRDSDLFILHQRCIFHHLRSPVEVTKKYTRLTNKKHIDLELVFSKPSIQNSMFEGKYRTTDLKSVSQALLGVGKYDDLDAGSSDISSLPIEEQIRYNVRDSEMVMLLAQHNNCLVLRIMKVFAGYAEMDYYLTCHTPINYWYANRYKKMLESGKCTIDNTPNYKLNKEVSGGGRHIHPIKGFFIGTKIYELDVKGLYPRIAINNNLSFDTLNCICCRNNEGSYLRQETIDAVNEQLKEDKIPRRVDKYWVCQRNKGALRLVLEQTLSDRDKYLALSKKEKKKEDPDTNLIEEYHTQQLGAKIFANAAVGVFANQSFDFSNYQVNECITAEGRRIHKKMESVVEDSYNFKVVFGFTDSIFLKDKGAVTEEIEIKKIHDFIQFCKNKLNVPVELKTIFINSIFYAKKNRFVAWTGNENEEPIIKGLDGLSDSNPLWVKRWFERILIELVKCPDTRKEVIPMMIKEAFEELDIPCCIDFSKELKYEQKVGKEIHEYKGEGCRTFKLAKLLGKDKGDLVYWYDTYEEVYVGKGKKKIKSYSIESEPENLNLDSYKELLLKKLKDSLEITGFNMATLKQELIKVQLVSPSSQLLPELTSSL